SDRTRFDGQSRLLLRSLLSGTSGTSRALVVFRKQQRANPESSLLGFIETLCGDEITRSEADTELLTMKPLVCLFPSLFKQNLLSFIHLVHSGLPRTAVLHLIKCLDQDSRPNPWVNALCRQLERNLGTHHEQPLYTTACSQRLKELSQHLIGSSETGGWSECFSGQTAKSESQSASDLFEVGTQRKRKGSFVHMASDGEEMGPQSKRTKMDDNECVTAEEQGAKKEMEGVSVSDTAAETPAQNSSCDALPQHIKVKDTWDQSSTDVFKVLNSCDPNQVEVLCSMLNFAGLPDQTLPKLCSSVLVLSPDLSYSTAATLIKGLLLEKVLSLSEPASRCLVTAVTSLCSRYPRPVCHALVGPVLEEKNIGPPQAELLSRLIESCLDSHYRLLVVQMTIKIAWSEAVLSIIHSLLDSQPVLNEEVFTQFTEHLVDQAPHFKKSVKFAKMMLTVLTKYNTHSLSSCLMLNETFLKKSLQAALKRITDT
uniref:FA complementation group E n=1 Tax=Amphilophus citrinellus TaxID=61819 RepID=A0A3Q0QYH0_AMPCI